MPITNTRGGFNPTQIAGCVVWLDANDSATITQNATSNISQWTNKSGNSLNAVSNSVMGYAVPTYVSTGAIKYVSMAPNQALYVPSYPYTTSWSVFSCMCNATIGGRWYISPFNDLSIVLMGMGHNGVNKIFNSMLGGISDATGAHIEYTSAQNTNSTGAYTYYRDGSLIDSNNTANTVNAATVRMGIGANAAFNSDMGGTYYPFEILMYNQYLGDTDRRNIEGYLAQKWGLTSTLPAGHPGLTSNYLGVGGASTRQSFTKTPYFRVFLPTSFAGCTLWLDASQDTTANGVSIASLVDRSGSGNSLTPSGTISAATNFLRGRTVYNFGSSRASKSNFPWQTSFTQIVLVKCATGNWLSSLVSGGAYLSYIFAGNENLINVNNFFDPRDSSVALATSVFTTAADGVSSWVILSLGYQSGATSASNYTINGTVRTTATSTAVSSALSSTNQLWLNGNGSSSFDTGTYVAEMIHYNAVLTSSQRQQVESYLAQKWGLVRYLPTDHGFYTNPGGGPQVGVVKTTISMTARPPAFVSEGLVFHLDAGNAASYSGSGSTWNDLAGSGLTTTLFNSPTYSSDNGGYLSFVPSSSQYGKTSASLSELTRWTVEIWHYYSATNGSGNPCILSEVWSNTPINFTIGSAAFGGNTTLQAAYFNSNWYYTAANYSLPSVGWYHIVGTYDGTTLTLYINNVSTRTQASAGTVASSGLGIHIMRRWDTGNYWGGRISIVRIYSRALTSTEITANYDASKARFGLS
jgi:hypothetical protein